MNDDKTATGNDHGEKRLLAIALRYSGEGAPRVTAKGYGVIGEQILERARKHAIPIRQDAELSGVLAGVPLGEEIPESLYLAVAEVLAFAYRLSNPIPDEPLPPPGEEISVDAQ